MKLPSHNPHKLDLFITHFETKFTFTRPATQDTIYEQTTYLFNSFYHISIRAQIRDDLHPATFLVNVLRAWNSWEVGKLGWPGCHPPAFIGAGNDCLAVTLPIFIFASFSAVSETPYTVLPLQMEVGLFLAGGRYLGCWLAAIFDNLWFFMSSWLFISNLRCTPVVRYSWDLAGENFLAGFELDSVPEYPLTDFCSKTLLVPADGGVLVTAVLERSDGGMYKQPWKNGCCSASVAVGLLQGSHEQSISIRLIACLLADGINTERWTPVSCGNW